MSPQLTPEQLSALVEVFRQASVPASTQTDSSQPQSAPAPSRPADLTFSLGGQTYTARDNAELQRIVDQVDNARQQELAAERTRLEAEAQLQASQIRQPAPAPAQMPAGQFDREQYAKLFLDDPRKAQSYLEANDPARMAFYAGLVGAVQQLENRVSETQQILDTQQFLNTTPDYEPTEKNYRAFESVMNRYNLPWSIQGMKAAHALGVQENAFETSAGPADTQDVQQSPQPVLPPRLKRQRGGSMTDNDQLLNQFEQLSPDKMKEYLQGLTVS